MEKETGNTEHLFEKCVSEGQKGRDSHSKKYLLRTYYIPGTELSNNIMEIKESSQKDVALRTQDIFPLTLEGTETSMRKELLKNQ